MMGYRQLTAASKRAGPWLLGRMTRSTSFRSGCAIAAVPLTMIAVAMIIAALSPPRSLAAGIAVLLASLAELTTTLIGVGVLVSAWMGPLREVNVGGIEGPACVVGVLISFLICLDADLYLEHAAAKHAHVAAAFRATLDMLTQWTPGIGLGLLAFLVVRVRRLHGKRLAQTRLAESDDPTTVLRIVARRLDALLETPDQEWAALEELGDEIRSLAASRRVTASSRQ